MHVICCYRVFGSAFLRRDAESEDARKMPDREEKAGKKQGYEKNCYFSHPRHLYNKEKVAALALSFSNNLFLF